MSTITLQVTFMTPGGTRGAIRLEQSFTYDGGDITIERAGAMLTAIANAAVWSLQPLGEKGGKTHGAP